MNRWPVARELLKVLPSNLHEFTLGKSSFGGLRPSLVPQLLGGQIIDV